jgi:hypothetical protein
MKHPIYYTVITGKRSCLVKYAEAPAYETRLFKGPFANPGNASQEFKLATQGDLEYLTEKAFEHKVSLLSARYKQDLAKLSDWNSGKAVRI